MKRPHPRRSSRLALKRLKPLCAEFTDNLDDCVCILINNQILEYLVNDPHCLAALIEKQTYPPCQQHVETIIYGGAYSLLNTNGVGFGYFATTDLARYATQAITLGKCPIRKDLVGFYLMGCMLVYGQRGPPIPEGVETNLTRGVYNEMHYIDQLFEPAREYAKTLTHSSISLGCDITRIQRNLLALPIQVLIAANYTKSNYRFDVDYFNSKFSEGEKERIPFHISASCVYGAIREEFVYCRSGLPKAALERYVKIALTKANFKLGRLMPIQERDAVRALRHIPTTYLFHNRKHAFSKNLYGHDDCYKWWKGKGDTYKYLFQQGLVFDPNLNDHWRDYFSDPSLLACSLDSYINLMPDGARHAVSRTMKWLCSKKDGVRKDAVFKELLHYPEEFIVNGIFVNNWGRGYRIFTAKFPLGDPDNLAAAACVAAAFMRVPHTTPYVADDIQYIEDLLFPECIQNVGNIQICADHMTPEKKADVVASWHSDEIFEEIVENFKKNVPDLLRIFNCVDMPMLRTRIGILGRVDIWRLRIPADYLDDLSASDGHYLKGILRDKPESRAEILNTLKRACGDGVYRYINGRMGYRDRLKMGLCGADIDITKLNLYSPENISSHIARYTKIEPNADSFCEAVICCASLITHIQNLTIDPLNKCNKKVIDYSMGEAAEIVVSYLMPYWLNPSGPKVEFIPNLFPSGLPPELIDAVHLHHTEWGKEWDCVYKFYR